MKTKIELKYNILLTKKKERVESNWERTLQKLEKKKNSELKKKEERFRRKMLNEIRELEWKPKRVYKTDAPKIKPHWFALEIAQENAKLRDTDSEGNWFCISCNRPCTRWELAWWHRYSRRIIGVCLDKENINAQCHSCNWTTWPRWDTAAKERTNHQYDINIDKKYWEWTADKLRDKVTACFQNKSEKYDYEMLIPRLIEENEKLWKTKSFYTPRKKRRAVWVKYSNRT